MSCIGLQKEKVSSYINALLQITCKKQVKQRKPSIETNSGVV